MMPEIGSLDLGDAVLLAITVFLSAFLLFQVQPLISKLILPWFGGSPAVWTTAMLFFQSALFGGYAYAHLMARHASARNQIGIHLVLLSVAAALAVLVVPGPSWKPIGDEEPIARILLLLAVSVGLPFFCLAATSPLIQFWLARAHPDRSAFRLFALSNAGSFLALLSFPFVFEPMLELPQMGRIWTSGFWLFALLCAAVTLRLGKVPGASPSNESRTAAAAMNASRERPTPIQRMGWILLPALASLAFIATTDHVSHDISPEPRLWIATLSLYLLTFIVCFDHPRWYRRAWVAPACALAVVLLTGRHQIPAWFGLEWDYGVTEVRWSHLATMFLICFMCHGELYRLRPGNPRYLTEFYLCMSFGGACGGLFVALFATSFFADYYEWTLTLVAAVLLASSILASEWSAWGSDPGLGGGLRAGLQRGHIVLPRSVVIALMSLVLLGLVLFWEDPLHWRSDSNEEYVDILNHRSRNFYGSVAVRERRYHKTPSENYRVFYSGRITHGLQYTDPAKRRLPVSYHSEGSGIGETLGYAMSRKPSLRVAVVGLGAGTLATYARQSDTYDFFEINPEVVRIADVWFDNLRNCLAHSKQVIVGDARLKMEQLPKDVLYDVIALDAFSGGSLPIHLLTREAFQIYRHHLKQDGFIVVNITNGYLNLYPVVRRQAEALGMGFRNKYQPPDPDRHIRRNQHFVATDDQDYLRLYPSVNREYYDAKGYLVRVEDPNIPDVPLWTDHFSSLNSIEIRD